MVFLQVCLETVSKSNLWGDNNCQNVSKTTEEIFYLCGKTISDTL